MGIINRLDRTIYNRISAGEVVENPASVVKELVENAIDAGSTEIEVYIEDGGIKSISVVDNGCGMEEDDLESCILPHATSKICCVEDLDTISTLGFRGEALASICAVSKTVIRSKFFQAEKANYVSVEDGEIIEKGTCSLQKGTTIEVSSLFYNTPARYRFLKTPKGEEGNITKLMMELILANPAIGFLYIADGKTIYASDGNGFESAVCTVFGAEIHDNMIPFKLEDKKYTVKGFASRPATCGIKGNKNNEVFIVNGRMINDSTMCSVVANAYGNRLMHRTFPSIVVDIVMPFDEVDVNVHPNKKEVRFADTQAVYGIVYSVIKTALNEDDQEQGRLLIQNLVKNIPVKNVLKDSFDVDSLPVAEVEQEEEPKDTFIIPVQDKIEKMEKGFVQYDTPLDMSKYMAPGSTISIESLFPTQLIFSDPTLENNAQASPVFKYIGQIFETYLIVEMDDKIYLIDQHAAQERLLFNKLVEKTNKNIVIQDLLVPVEVPLEEEKTDFFRKHIDDFSNLGFGIKVEDNYVIVLSVPMILVGMDVLNFISTVCSEIKEINDFSDIDALRDKLAQKACKSAIKGGDVLGKEEAEYFLKDYLKGNAPTQCPHGRPVVLTFSRAKIEKLFGRIV